MKEDFFFLRLQDSYLAVNAHASAVVPAVYVQTCSPALHLGIIITVSGMRMALAGYMERRN